MVPDLNAAIGALRCAGLAVNNLAETDWRTEALCCAGGDGTAACLLLWSIAERGPAMGTIAAPLDGVVVPPRRFEPTGATVPWTVEPARDRAGAVAAFSVDTTGRTALEAGDVTRATVRSTVEAAGAVALETVETTGATAFEIGATTRAVVALTGATTGAAVLLTADVTGAMVFNTVDVTGATVLETGAGTGATALEIGATTGATELLLTVTGEPFVVTVFGAVEGTETFPGRETGGAVVFEAPPDPAVLLVIPEVDTCGAVAGTETATGAVVFDGAVPVAPDDVGTETRDAPGGPSASALSVSRKSDTNTPMMSIGSRRARYRRRFMCVSRLFPWMYLCPSLYAAFSVLSIGS